MPSRTDRIDFGPPSDAGRLRAVGLALLAHMVLIGALTWGVNWKRSDTTPSFSAELWSSTVQEAAPPLPTPASPELPTPQRLPPAAAPPKVMAAPDVDIALEQEKKRKQAQQKLQREQEDAQDKRQAAMDAKAEKDAQAKRAKQDEAKRQADEAKKKDTAAAEAKVKAAAVAANNAAAEQQRKQNLARAMGMAGAQGDESSKGTALTSKGPSAGYGGKVRAKVMPNIVFTDAIDGNPKAEVEVRTAPDGTVISQRLVKPSGNKAWDEAVIKAIIRTETMPRDVDGRVPTPMILEFRPRD